MIKIKLSIFLILAITISEVALTHENQHKKEEGSSTVENKILGEKIKYLDEIEHEKKRYVGDAQKEDLENPKRRGLKKRYVGEESDTEFFEEEKEALYKYDSLEKVPNKTTENLEHEKKGQEPQE